MDRFRVGEVLVSRVEEWSGGFSGADFLFPSYDDGSWNLHEHEFVPHFYLREERLVFGVLQSWVIDTGKQRILFDTGAGNAKERPGIPIFGNLATPFIERLATAGYRPEDIDLVVCSHLHIDHVGWNTQLIEGRWTVTFPNAEYVLPRADRDYWDPSVPDARPTEQGTFVNSGVFEDSVQPVIDRGRDRWVGDGDELGPGLVLHAAPGHTPGQMMLEVQSRGESAFFVGDIMHHPMQIYRPDWNSRFCEEPLQARVTRRTVLETVADRGALLVPAHFGGEHVVRVTRDGTGFRPVYVS